MAYAHDEEPSLLDHLSLPAASVDIDAELEKAEADAINPNLTEEERGEAKSKQLRLRAQRIGMIAHSSLSNEGESRIVENVEESPIKPRDYDGPPIEHVSGKMTMWPKTKKN